jgi:NTE family protein
MSATRRALVLGGGGVAGIAWETGILAGLRDEGVDVAAGADLVVGTSAGSAVAAQVTSGATYDDLVARQLVPPEQSGEIAAEIDVVQIGKMFLSAVRDTSSAKEMRAAIGRGALAADTVPEAARRAVSEHRVPSHEWPASPELRSGAADAQSGEPRVFSAADGVAIVDAVAASCAVPGVWPPVTIEGHRYIDGGVRSITNADLATGYDIVLVLAPFAETPPLGDPEALAAIDALTERAAVLTLLPDEASLAAMGANPLDPAVRAPTVTAARAQGRTLAAEVAAKWEKS